MNTGNLASSNPYYGVVIVRGIVRVFHSRW